MEFLYALINFIILAALAWLILGKSTVRRFKERRERISAELDGAEAILCALPQEPEEAQLPAQSSNKPGIELEEELENINKQRDEAIAKLEKEALKAMIELIETGLGEG